MRFTLFRTRWIYWSKNNLHKKFHFFSKLCYKPHQIVAIALLQLFVKIELRWEIPFVIQITLDHLNYAEKSASCLKWSYENVFFSQFAKQVFWPLPITFSNPNFPHPFKKCLLSWPLGVTIKSAKKICRKNITTNKVQMVILVWHVTQVEVLLYFLSIWKNLKQI